MTDKEIIEHLQHNKYSLALKGLYDSLPSVKQYIKANNGSEDDAKDIFQDALVVLYKNVHSGELILTAPLKHYLLAIVRNCWLQELRKRKKMPGGEIILDIISTESDKDPAFDDATAAFNLLGEKCKKLLVLFYFKKKNYKEIAVALAFTDEKIAKNQKYRCLQKAKEIYLNISKKGIHE